MAIAGRLKRLEAILARKGGPRQKTFDETLADAAALWAWLEDRGYPDCLAALEAGETGPEGLEDMLREQATYDPHRRAFARIEAALDAGRLPVEANVKLMERDGKAGLPPATSSRRPSPH
jgi:hypothetical protein